MIIYVQPGYMVCCSVTARTCDKSDHNVIDFMLYVVAFIIIVL